MLVSQIRAISVQMAVFGFLLLLLLINVAFLVRKGSEYAKKLTFSLMIAVIAFPTAFFLGSTIYINVISATGGPVHWHADFRIIACGEELLPPEPDFWLSNKTGSSRIHQHVDNRLHVEGVLVTLKEASFANFFALQGGRLTKDAFLVPHLTGPTWYRNGDQCPDGTTAEWSVFIYETDVEEGTISKRQMSPSEVPGHIPAPHINVPPGDCVIFEYGEPKDDTDLICSFTQIAINQGDYTPTWRQ
jgi:hypothetical protein